MSAPETAFGRHVSFQLRYGWLSKGVAAFSEDADVFTRDDATVKLGVGKNMVTSIRYWMQATGVIDKSGLTRLGERLFGKDGFDPYLEDDGTLWLLHFNLASNKQLASGAYWLFNHWHKSEFSAAEAFEHLVAFVAENRWQGAENTIKMDIQVFLRMYAPHKSAKTKIEEMLESPMSLLGLLEYHDGRYHSMPGDREELPLEIMAYALAVVMGDKPMIPVRDLMHGEGTALGSIFKLTENALIAKIEQIATQNAGYELREDAGISQLHCMKTIDPEKVLESYYKSQNRGGV
ncbi:MAG: DUF4007 family protein [Gammaproteobacteria bacterium]|nr:DUF4007 family protein [Gammaproteobacteria bacterium]CAJ2376998.1 MAG: conserved hypothetical protein [Arenicellales bacterium IbO2]MDA7961607.1 DUF4007 family protein [Gammaproteobacteria bacterium]MDA7970028.1 DUF4007 family protein [Gammaproteobacteria bacterium]MDA7995422.1 DUF4007 family protein [Gammaproteobacteria bacterium]